MNILVIGGSGFIGSNLIENLLKQNKYNIYCLDNYFTGTKNNHFDNVKYIEGNSWDIDKFFPDIKFKIIFHFGEYSRISTSFEDINILYDSILKGTPKVLEYCLKNNTKLIYSASSSKFGNNGEDENLSPYSWMKAKMVELIKNYNKWFNLQYQIVYFYNVYGPRQIYNSKYSTVIAIFEEHKKNNQKLTVVRPGTQKRNFTHIYDITEGLIKIINLENNINQEWNLGNNQKISIIELAKMFDRDYIFIDEKNGDRKGNENINNNTKEILNWNCKYQLNNYIKNNIN